MLTYCKMILDKMTIDKNLFLKELKKAYKMLTSEEAIELNRWVLLKYPHLVANNNIIYLQA
ncbi:MAG: hypothetical protein GQ527_06700 [Bacteroidales bacterium]|nr:hypothetical protein [Bacteroidales bacterium]